LSEVIEFGQIWKIKDFSLWCI